MLLQRVHFDRLKGLEGTLGSATNRQPSSRIKCAKGTAEHMRIVPKPMSSSASSADGQHCMSGVSSAAAVVSAGELLGEISSTGTTEMGVSGGTMSALRGVGMEGVA